jgi:signal transduction histidine kinase/WD40 repeat protein
VKKFHFPTYARSMMSPAYCPGNNLFGLCGEDRSISLFDLMSDFQQRIEMPLQPNRIAFSPDGTVLAVAAEEQLYIIDRASAGFVRTNGFSARINQVNWSPRGIELVMALENGEIVQFNPQSGASMVMRGHIRFAENAYYHPDGNVIASTSWDQTSRFWDASDGQLLFKSIAGFAHQFSADGRRLAFHKETFGLGVWDFEIPQVLQTIIAPLKATTGLRWVDVHPALPLFTACDPEEFIVWNYENGKLLHREPFRLPFSIQFDQTGSRLFASGSEGLKVFDVQGDGDGIRLSGVVGLGDLAGVRQLERSAMTSDRQTYVVGGQNVGFVMDAATLNVDFQFGKGLGPLAFSAISPDRRWLVATSWKQAGTCLWDLTGKRYLGPLHPSASSADFSPDGSLLATANNQGLQIWTTGAWEIRNRIDHHSLGYAPGPVRFSPDGEFLATTLDPQTILLVDSKSGEPVLRLSNPGELNNYHLCFSKDGTRLFAATPGRTIHHWDLPALKAGVTAMGLPWPLDRPKPDPLIAIAAGASRDPGAAGNGVIARLPVNLFIGVIVLGVLLAVLFGASTLRQQARLVSGYERIEKLAEEQNQRLLQQETELLQGQKMKALGTLAAGVAHDFNNLLSVISLANDFLKRGTKGDPGLEDETGAIYQAVRQGRQVVEGMLGYSRGTPSTEPEQFALCDLVEDAIGLLGHQFLSGIRLTLELDRSARPIHAIKGKVEQILLNLIINASDAMNGKGKLEIKVRIVQPGEIPTRVLAPTAGSPSFQTLEVQDNGPGIPADITDRIFEPFFTTKDVGAKQGTGLGLSTVYTIAEHEGYGLDVESHAGKGACFRVLIPAPPARESRSDKGGGPG